MLSANDVAGPALAIAAILLCASPWAQQSAIAPIPPHAPAILRPYLAHDVPPVRLANSPRLGELVRAGTLYLTVQDAIALALENNIDIEVARYNPLIQDWNVTRSEAGGTLPGVPSNASQAGAVASGQGVAGSQQAAGVSAPGTGSARVQSTNAVGIADWPGHAHARSHYSGSQHLQPHHLALSGRAGERHGHPGRCHARIHRSASNRGCSPAAASP